VLKEKKRKEKKRKRKRKRKRKEKKERKKEKEKEIGKKIVQIKEKKKNTLKALIYVFIAFILQVLLFK